MRKLQFLVGLIISGIALYLALRGIKWDQVASALREANYLLLLPAVLALASVFVFRTFRWRLLFYPLTNLRLSKLFGTITVAYLVNNTLPFQLGDLARAYVISELEGVRKSRALSTVVVERMMDVFVLVLLLILLIPFISVPSWASLPAAAVGLGFLFLGGLLLAAVINRNWVIAIVEAIPAFLPQRLRARAKDSAHSAIDGLSVLSNPLVLAQVLAWTVIQWLVSAAALYCIMMAFQLDVPFDAAIFVMVVISFGFLIPSSPGSVGVYHALSVQALVSVYAVEKGAALSYALVAHLLYYIPPVIIGLLFLWQQRFTWERLRLLTREAEPASEELSGV
jgi:uncharacterized protein (TIRG00374 family)